MLKQRVLTAVLLAPAVVAGIIYLPLSFFTSFISILVLLGFWEWRKFVVTNSPNGVFAIALVLTFASLYFVHPISHSGVNFTALTELSFFILAGVLWWLVTLYMIKNYPDAAAWWEKNTILQQSFGWLTLIPFMFAVLSLRNFQYNSDPYLGAKLVLLVCVIVWAADTGAYFAGKSLGKHKLAPRVSPNKTIEGFVGGLVASILAMMLFVKIFAIPFTSVYVMIFVAVVTSLISVVGDLVESMFKRAAGIKDSGNILPGHGGILDRIDSLTAAFPVFTLLYFGLA